MYVCIYIYVCIRVCMYIHVYVYPYIHVCMQSDHACVCTYVQLRPPEDVSATIPARLCIHMRATMPLCAWIRKSVHAHVYVHLSMVRPASVHTEVQ